MSTPQLIAVLENPNYIMNIGTVIRNVNALGVDKLYVIDGLNRLESDLEQLRQRKSILKHSKGAVKYTHVQRFDTSIECLDLLEQQGFCNVATSPHSHGVQHYHLPESPLTQPLLAIWFGDEANGLSDTILQRCQFCISIDMMGNVESLNLATATGIVLYEALRQRHQLKS
ncbi:TrmH family RNA methyltransferase [Mangrovimonas sp. YM274]|uniref:TrmH family RNA methyltransferase n=1 Tax=Mangrovimonas sp. YM274 TaxID=3070660 RepID=UPI0027DB531C|nr:TrmH family RNA methyltransferase [Mangrovimonas sp. YM274]WMI68521.1 TrmH family RNA methyltransferase [Mangrovimonas sp. YM274]